MNERDTTLDYYSIILVLGKENVKVQIEKFYSSFVEWLSRCSEANLVLDILDNALQKKNQFIL